MRLWLFLLIFGLGCGSPPRPKLRGKAVRPPLKGDPTVLLVRVTEHRFVPLACHDPIWARLRGAADCADLVPPSAHIVSDKGRAILLKRGPFDCGYSPGVAFDLPLSGQLAWWPDDVPPQLTYLTAHPLTTWPIWAQGGWMTSLPDGRQIAGLDLGGFGGLFQRVDKKWVVLAHFRMIPRPIATVDLAADGNPALLISAGEVWGLYGPTQDGWTGISGCVVPGQSLTGFSGWLRKPAPTY